MMIDDNDNDDAEIIDYGASTGRQLTLRGIEGDSPWTKGSPEKGPTDQAFQIPEQIGESIGDN